MGACLSAMDACERFYVKRAYESRRRRSFVLQDHYNNNKNNGSVSIVSTSIPENTENNQNSNTINHAASASQISISDSQQLSAVHHSAAAVAAVADASGSLNLSSSINFKVTCPICYEKHPIKMTRTCSCSHTFCTPCWSTYVHNQRNMQEHARFPEYDGTIPLSRFMRDDEILKVPCPTCRSTVTANININSPKMKVRYLVAYWWHRQRILFGSEMPTLAFFVYVSRSAQKRAFNDLNMHHSVRELPSPERSTTTTEKLNRVQVKFESMDQVFDLLVWMCKYTKIPWLWAGTLILIWDVCSLSLSFNHRRDAQYLLSSVLGINADIKSIVHRVAEPHDLWLWYSSYIRSSADADAGAIGEIDANTIVTETL